MGANTDFEKYFKSAPIALMVIDQSGHILECNYKAIKLIKYKARNSPKKWSDIFTTNKELPDFNSFGEELQLSNIKLTNGNICNIILSKTEVGKAICYLKETSLNKLAISELKEVTKKLRMFVEQAPAAVAMFDNEMNYISCSQKWVDDWIKVNKKVSNKSIIGKNHYELFPDVTDEWKKGHQRALRGETLSKEREFFVNGQGDNVWLRWEARPWYLNKKDIGGVMLFTEIITQTVETELALKASDEFNRRLIEDSPIIIVIQDGKGKLLYTNPAARKFIGAKSPEQVIGKYSAEFIDEEYHEIVRNRIQATMNSSEPASPIEIKFHTIDGEVKIGMSTIIPFEYNHEPAILGVINDITEIREATDQLQTNQARLRQIIDLVPHHIFAKDDKGNIIMANKAFAAFWDTTTEYIEEHLAVPQSPKLKDEMLESYESDDQEVIRKQKPKTTPIETIVNKDGSTTYFQTTKVPYLGNNNSPIALLGISADITERIEYEKKLSNSQRRYKALLNALPDLIFVNSVQGDFLDYHAKAEDLLVPPSEFLGKNVTELFEQKLANKFLESFKKAVKSREPVIINYTLNAMGYPEHFEARIVDYGDNRILSVIRNFTLQKQTEEAFRKSEERLELFFSQSLDGFYVMEADKPIKWDNTVNKKKQIKEVFKHLKIVKINQAMANQYESTENEMIGFTLNDFFQHDLEYGYQILTELLDNKHQQIIVNERKMSGEMIWTEGDYLGLFNSKNEITGIFGIQRDITKRIKDEEDLKNLTEDLIKSNNELQQFAYITSHDLRAPVVNLKMLLNFYDKGQIHKNNLELFEKIEDSVKRLDTSLNDLVDIVAISKTQSERNVKVSFKEVTEDILQNIGQEIKSRKATIKTDYSSVRVINYPLTHIKSILQNLITNALKYQKPRTPPIIQISTKREGNYIKIEVSDNGLGINLSKHGSNLFGMYQKFHKVENSKGLGLYIIKTQIESMSGKIEVRSKVRKGTSFYVYLEPQ